MSNAELTAGYCGTCGRYGRGRFVEVINSHSDAIDQHEGCPAERPPTVVQPRHIHRGEPEASRRIRSRQP